MSCPFDEFPMGVTSPMNDSFDEFPLHYDELEIVMRQEKDQEFAEMCSMGVTYTEDCDYLDQKVRMCTREYFTDLVSKFYNHFDEYGSMMLLAHSNEMIGKLNRTQTEQNINIIDNIVVTTDLTILSTIETSGSNCDSWTHQYHIQPAYVVTY
ncbi:hypothetical protein CRE_02377 [Caenorhabditis remanei]|uniref:Uncharacterized protein n=1 Tax=Caenorhabditis remanei TaxID=31234 RepID=E3MIH8_CAERE|nr:hypothetical protein CRE_02377 [Caenorhabditis remanei]